jgi:hypothetical protein
VSLSLTAPNAAFAAWCNHIKLSISVAREVLPRVLKIVIQFEEAKASQSDGSDSVKLSLYMNVKVSQIVMGSTDTNA